MDFHNVKVYADTPDARPLFVYEKVQRSPETEGLLNALKQVPQKGFMFGHHDAPILWNRLGRWNKIEVMSRVFAELIQLSCHLI